MNSDPDSGEDFGSDAESDSGFFDKKRGCPPPPPPHYQPPRVHPSQCLRFNETSAWDPSRLHQSGILSLTFGPEFDIKDWHIEELALQSQFCQNLLTLRAGSSDSGKGGQVHDASLLKLLPLLQSLRDLDLSSFHQVTGAVFPSIEKLPHL